MGERYGHLGGYSGWVEEADRRGPLYPAAPPGERTRGKVRELLGFYGSPEEAAEIRVEGTWEREGVSGEEVSWSLGYGPRTHAWVLKPSGVHGTLPGVIALHGHDGFKFYGKEKIADGPDDPEPVVTRMRERMYDGRAFPNALAREGFVVPTTPFCGAAGGSSWRRCRIGHGRSPWPRGACTRIQTRLHPKSRSITSQPFITRTWSRSTAHC
jgi:hypothetical protein